MTIYEVKGLTSWTLFPIRGNKTVASLRAVRTLQAQLIEQYEKMVPEVLAKNPWAKDKVPALRITIRTYDSDDEGFFKLMHTSDKAYRLDEGGVAELKDTVTIDADGNRTTIKV